MGGWNGVSALTDAELYNPATGTWAVTKVLNTARYQHTATLLANGKVLVAAGAGAGNSAEYYDTPGGGWHITGSMITPRGYPSVAAVSLPNGNILVSGSDGGYNALSAAEKYDPNTEVWTATSSMITARFNHTATLLPSGRVLVAGGNDINPDNNDYVFSSAELYDPTTSSWTPTGSMNIPRGGRSAILLANGKVLVEGGNNNSAELYDPATGSWTTTGSMHATRGDQTFTMTLLPNGNVLVAGGFDYAGYDELSSAEIYNPSSGTWSLTGAMTNGRYYHTAVLLPNGKVLVAGGANYNIISGVNYLTSSELYDPATGIWTSTGSLNQSRDDHTATLLQNGKVLAAGGYGIPSAELYDPASGMWTRIGSMTVSRYFFTAIFLHTGKVLILGGAGNSTELYDVGLAFSASCQPQITTARSPLLPGGNLALTGSGFRGISGGSSGNSQDSPADYPVVQLRSVESGQTMFLSPAAGINWSSTSFTAAPVNGFPYGYAMASVFANGIPSGSALIAVTKAPASVTLGNLTQYYDGTPKSVTATTVPSGLTVNLTYNGSANAPSSPGSYNVIGTINDPLYQGSATSVLVINAVAPAIVRQPLSQTVQGGASVTLNVGATGGPLYYQWFQDGAAIPDATQSTLNFDSVSLSDAGNYSVVVSNTAGVTVSDVASLTILVPPNDQLAGAVVISASYYTNWQSTASATSVGDPANPSFLQNGVWYTFTPPTNGTIEVDTIGSSFDTVLAVYANVNSNLTLLALDDDSGGNGCSLINNFVIAAGTTYYFLAGGYYGDTGDLVFHLAASYSPFITSPPQSQFVAVGSDAFFSASAVGATPFSYQWQFNGTNIAGATGSNYILHSAQCSNSGGYAVVVTNSYGSVTSSVATLTVGQPPGIAQQPTNLVVLLQSAGVFTVSVSGTGPFAFQWQHNGNNLFSSIITTVAGSGRWGYYGDGGAATSGRLYYPVGVAVDAAGNFFIADTGNNCIRQAATNGIITTVAGNGTNDYSGDGGAATNASLNSPGNVAVDAFGNLFVADGGNNRIRKVDANGIITTVAGNGNNDYSGDGGAATNASLSWPGGVAVDALGSLFVADSGNNRIREVDTNGIITTVAGSGSWGYSGDGGSATDASLNWPASVAVGAFGDLFIADAYNARIRRVMFFDWAIHDGTLILNHAAPGELGNYSVIVSSPYGSVTSGIVTLSLAFFTPQIQVNDSSFGVRSNYFGFNVVGGANQVVVIETCTNLATPNWVPLQTNMLVGVPIYFCEPVLTNVAGRFYRLREVLPVSPPQIQFSDAGFGVWSNGFGFNLTGAPNQVVVVEACTNLATPNWVPLQTNTMVGAPVYFSEPILTNAASRFYRLRVLE